MAAGDVGTSTELFSIALAVLTRLENRRNRAHVLTVFGSCQNLASIHPGELRYIDRVKYRVSLLDTTHYSPGWNPGKHIFFTP